MQSLLEKMEVLDNVDKEMRIAAVTHHYVWTKQQTVPPWSMQMRTGEALKPVFQSDENSLVWMARR